MAFLGHFPAQLGQQRAGGPTGTAHYQLDADGADGLDYVVDLAVFPRPSTTRGSMNPTSWVNAPFPRPRTRRRAARCAAARPAGSPPRRPWSRVSRTSIAATSTTSGAVGTDPERSQAGLFGHVPGDPGRPAGDGDDMKPGLLGRLDGVDGALAHGAVGPQQGAVEVRGDQSHRGQRARRRRWRCVDCAHATEAIQWAGCPDAGRRRAPAGDLWPWPATAVAAKLCSRARAASLVGSLAWQGRCPSGLHQA